MVNKAAVADVYVVYSEGNKILYLQVVTHYLILMTHKLKVVVFYLNVMIYSQKDQNSILSKQSPFIR